MSDQSSESCCTISQAQILRNEAMIMGRRSEAFVKEGDTAGAETLLAAADLLIKKSGGEDSCEEAFLLWTARVGVAQKRGDTTLAVTQAQKAYDVVLAVHGLDHPSVGLALGNLGEMLLDNGQWSTCQEILRQAISHLELSASVGIWTREYMDGITAAFKEMLERARTAFPRSSTEGNLSEK